MAKQLGELNSFEGTSKAHHSLHIKDRLISVKRVAGEDLRLGFKITRILAESSIPEASYYSGGINGIAMCIGYDAYLHLVLRKHQRSSGK